MLDCGLWAVFFKVILARGKAASLPSAFFGDLFCRLVSMALLIGIMSTANIGKIFRRNHFSESSFASVVLSNTPLVHINIQSILNYGQLENVHLPFVAARAPSC